MRRSFPRVIAPLALVVILVNPGGFAALAAPLSADMIVNVPDQVLALVDRGKLIARYSISTSKFGTGDSAASYRTPLGTLCVSAKIGDRLPPGTVIKNRIPTGEIVGVDAPGRDPIVSRVIWLRGMEAQNQKARDRCIYIHGTPEEPGSANRPASVAFACGPATSSTSTITCTSAHTS
jgi:lipoprotein-anchoring transpeptidase ErfK/SrfK